MRSHSTQADPAAAIRAHAPEGVDRVIEVSLSDNADLDAAVLRPAAAIAAYASRDDRPAIPFWPMLFSNLSIRLLGSDDFPAEAKRAGRSRTSRPRRTRVRSPSRSATRCRWTGSPTRTSASTPGAASACSFRSSAEAQRSRGRGVARAPASTGVSRSGSRSGPHEAQVVLRGVCVGYVRMIWLSSASSRPSSAARRYCCLAALSSGTWAPSRRLPARPSRCPSPGSPAWSAPRAPSSAPPFAVPARPGTTRSPNRPRSRRPS